jgi:hypothetical protein
MMRLHETARTLWMETIDRVKAWTLEGMRNHEHKF